MNKIIKPGQLSLSDLHEYWKQPISIDLSQDSFHVINHSFKTVQAVNTQEKRIYGVNTGFGRLASIRINQDDLKTLQSNLLLSHSCGTGEVLEKNLVKLVL